MKKKKNLFCFVEDLPGIYFLCFLIKNFIFELLDQELWGFCVYDKFKLFFKFSHFILFLFTGIVCVLAC